MLPISRIGVIHLTWSRILQRQLLPYRLSLKQLHVLQELLRRGRLYPAEIAEMLFVDRPTATVVIRNLERDGLVLKERDPENGKRFIVTLTTAGKRKVEAVRRSGFLGNRGLELEHLFTGFELGQLDAMLKRLQHHLERLG